MAFRKTALEVIPETGQDDRLCAEHGDYRQKPLETAVETLL